MCSVNSVGFVMDGHHLSACYLASAIVVALDSQLLPLLSRNPSPELNCTMTRRWTRRAQGLTSAVGH